MDHLPSQQNLNQPSSQPTVHPVESYATQPQPSTPQAPIPNVQPDQPLENNKNSLLRSLALFKVGVIQLFLVIIALAFILAVLNYFKILPIQR